MGTTTIFLQGEELLFQNDAVTSKGAATKGKITITNQRFIWEKSKGINAFLSAGLIGLGVRACATKNFSVFLKDINAIQGVKTNIIEFILNDGTSFGFALACTGFLPKNTQEKRDDIVNYIQGIINQQ